MQHSVEPENTNKGLVWVVDDEPEIRDLLVDYLTHEGFACRAFEHGDAMLESFQSQQPDVLLLDIMMPGTDGLSLCQKIRERSQLPILFLSARHEEFDRILGLKLGADDYLAKPFSPREVVARVEALLRRSRWQSTPAESLKTNLSFQSESLEATYHGHVLQLTVVEYRLLEHLATHPGRVFRRSELMDVAYDDHRVVSDRTVDSHIKNLRAKLHEVASEEELIQSVYGLGYKFVAPSYGVR
ncbi:MAG: response regulator [Idiomarina sp.]|nr:response regulator [Idiomarina sp.]